ncbi:MAG: hypothetical protein WD398_14445 [Cyclobacteriaceae bacterium]
MSKIISIWKRREFDPGIENKLLKICTILEPDNIQANKPVIHVNGKWSYGIMNPTSSLLKTGSGVLLGRLFGDFKEWDEIGHSGIDGSFALFRDHSNFCEICSDVAGTRSIWYYMNKEYFITSTSQRAIVMFLGGFEFNQEVVPWMLSTGSLGPFLSWDKRIKLLPPDSALLLDKESWTAELKTEPIVFKSRKITKKEGYDRVFSAIHHTFDHLRLDFDKWAVTLSGGRDSRGILLTLLAKSEAAKKIKTYTHGHRGNQEIKGTDGYIAKKIADKYGLRNDFFSSMTISEEESLEVVYDRILKVGEGRVDHIKAYLDGFSFWKYLFDSKTEGILRGDMSFGFPFNVKLKTEKEANKFTNFFPCQHYANLAHLENSGMKKHVFPDELRPMESESMNVFLERIYSVYRTPIVLAALSDFKLSYVEVLSPLLSRKILNAVRSLPENLRLGTPIWKAYINQLENKIPYSHQDAHDPLDQEDLKKAFYDYKLKSIRKSHFLPEYLKDLIPEIKNPQQISFNGNNLRLKDKIRKLISRKQRFFIWKYLGGNHKKEVVSKGKLMDRLFIISEMQRILHSDANTLNSIKS